MKMKDIINLLEIERKRLDAAIRILEVQNPFEQPLTANKVIPIDSEPAKHRRAMSVAAKKRISDAQKLRWAKRHKLEAKQRRKAA